jgi:hypothetical protein
VGANDEEYFTDEHCGGVGVHTLLSWCVGATGRCAYGQPLVNLDTSPWLWSGHTVALSLLVGLDWRLGVLGSSARAALWGGARCFKLVRTLSSVQQSGMVIHHLLLTQRN